MSPAPQPATMPPPSPQAQATTLASTVVSILAVITVILRFITRKLTKAGLGADDWWILIGLIIMFLIEGLLLYGVKSDPEGGELIDRDSPTFNYAPHTTYLKISFTAAVLYFQVVTAIKISILLMYRRVFAVDSFRRYSLGVGGVVMVWWLVGTVATIVSCLPINRLWIGPKAGGYCFNFGIFWMCMGAVEIVVDSVILVMPVGMVVKLWMSRQQKVLITGIFLLGGFVVVTGLLRVVLGYKPGSQNVAFAKAELWGSVHIGTAIICACLPTLRPMLTRATASVSSLTKRFYGSGISNTGDLSGGYSGSSAGSKNNATHVELRPVRSRDGLGDPHADTQQLTRGSGELRTFNHTEFEAPRQLGSRFADKL